MNLIERVQALVDGKKIRRTDWDEEGYFKLTDGQIFDEEHRQDVRWADRIFETGGEWELYEESPSSLPLERRMGYLECFVKQQVHRTDDLEERLKQLESFEAKLREEMHLADLDIEILEAKIEALESSEKRQE